MNGVVRQQEPCAHEDEKVDWTLFIEPDRIVIGDRVQFNGFKCMVCRATFTARPADAWMTPQEEREAAFVVLEDIYGGENGKWDRSWIYKPPEVIIHGLLQRIGDPLINLCANILGRAAADQIIPANYKKQER